MPLAMGAATERERKAPARLRTAATLTAVLGVTAPVAIDVAMAFAVSWKPSEKSKASAVPTTRDKMTLCTPVFSSIGRIQEGSIRASGESLATIFPPLMADRDHSGAEGDSEEAQWRP